MQMLLSKRHEIRGIAVVIKKKYGIAQNTRTAHTHKIFIYCDNDCLQHEKERIIICSLNLFTS